MHDPQTQATVWRQPEWGTGSRGQGGEGRTMVIVSTIQDKKKIKYPLCCPFPVKALQLLHRLGFARHILSTLKCPIKVNAKDLK